MSDLNSGRSRLSRLTCRLQETLVACLKPPTVGPQFPLRWCYQPSVVEALNAIQKGRAVLFAYVMNRERSHPDGPTHEGILLYPTVGDETRVDFETHGHRFQARSVDLGRPWREVHEAMLSVLTK